MSLRIHAARLALALMVAACAIAPGRGQPPPVPAADESELASLPATLPAPIAAAAEANELGEVVVLEYHDITFEGRYSRSPQGFENELEAFYRAGFRPVSLAEFLRGEFAIPAGTHPMLLTFDDGRPSQLRYRDDGTLDPLSAVGILDALARRHPDFRPKALFFLNERPFGTPDWPNKLRDLLQRGYDIGNHTWGHVNLSAVSADEARAAIDRLEDEFSAALGERIEMHALALPFGAAPKDPDVLSRFSAVFLVGAGPARVPTDARFDRLAVPRIQSVPDAVRTDFGSGQWLRMLRARPDLLFTVRR